MDCCNRALWQRIFSGAETRYGIKVPNHKIVLGHRRVRKATI